jgi:hypothetical protein
MASIIPLYSGLCVPTTWLAVPSLTENGNNVLNLVKINTIYWHHDYLCNQCLSPLTLRVRIPLRQGVLDTPLCDKSFPLILWLFFVFFTGERKICSITCDFFCSRFLIPITFHLMTYFSVNMNTLFITMSLEENKILKWHFFIWSKQ